jgi:hypothetical protein
MANEARPQSQAALGILTRNWEDNQLIFLGIRPLYHASVGSLKARGAS